jgi:hypothetical protein
MDDNKIFGKDVIVKSPRNSWIVPEFWQRCNSLVPKKCMDDVRFNKRMSSKSDYQSETVWIMRLINCS